MSSSSPLLLLPAEIRNDIYTRALHIPNPIAPQQSISNRRNSLAWQATSAGGWMKSGSSQASYTPLPCALLHTCTQIRREASGIYYSLNIFTFSSAAQFLAWSSILNKSTLDSNTTLIQEMRIVLQRHELQLLRFWKTLADATKFGGLVRLGLCIRPSLTQKWLCDKLLGIRKLEQVTLGAIFTGEDEDRERLARGGDGGRRWNAVRFEMEAMALKGWEVQINRVLRDRRLLDERYDRLHNS